MTRARVVVAEPLHPAALAWLRERAEVVEGASDEALRGADGLIVRTYTRVDSARLEKAPGLRVVGRAGVGLDNVDVEACAARCVRVVHTPEANTGAVVEYVLSAVLSALRAIESVGAMSAEEWARERESAIAAKELSECVVGIWGMGRIGKAVAGAFGPLARGVVYNDLLEIPEADRCGATPVAVDELLERADVLTLHVDGREANRGLVDAAALAQMKKDAVLVNAARGMVVDSHALAEFLRANSGAWAVLDVHEVEPIAQENPLLGLKNATLTAHVGAATARAKEAMSWVVKDVWKELQEKG